MQPTISPGDVILAVPGDPSAESIVVFKPPPSWTSDPTPFVKRVIGLGGDTIEMRRGAVVRNGKVLEESYAQGPTEAAPDQSTWVVPDGSVFVLGDNRQRSADSRVFGAIPIGNVLGIASWRCRPSATPLVPTG